MITHLGTALVRVAQLCRSGVGLPDFKHQPDERMGEDQQVALPHICERIDQTHRGHGGHDRLAVVAKITLSMNSVVQIGVGVARSRFAADGGARGPEQGHERHPRQRQCSGTGYAARDWTIQANTTSVGCGPNHSGATGQ